MKYFIFRNNTIEPFFDEGAAFSGYGDISLVPAEAEAFVWFYQVPFKADNAQLAAEVRTYADQFELVLEKIGKSRNILAFTLEDLFPLRLADSDSAVSEAVAEFNAKLIALAERNSNIKIVDSREFTSRYAVEQLVDWKYYFIAQMQLNPKLAREFKVWFGRKEEEVRLKRKKCLALDLDNTLWGGVLGEDGIEGIKIGGDYPGKAFHLWQEELLELSRNGVILAACSKNNEKDVMEAWEKNPYMVLRRDNFSAYEINWDDKATNLQRLANELNIGLDSFVFVDDNPTERELIRQTLPMVEVPDFPAQPYGLPSFFKFLVDNYFRIYSITDEDRNKTAQYKANAERAKEQLKFIDFEDYLRSLQIRIDIIGADGFNKERIAQMTQKTNQFNLTTKRYADADVQRMMDEEWSIYCISVKDKFGDNGITGTVFITPKVDGVVEIDELLLSCRILGKGIETAFVQSVMNKLYSEDVKEVKATFVPTAKNAQVADFYDRMGFNLVSEKDGVKEYRLELAGMFDIKNYYTIQYK